MSKTAIVLAGGGSRGAYQLGVWKALREMGVDYQLVTGTSVGALNGTLMVQQDYEKACQVWENITSEDIVGDMLAEKGDLNDHQLNRIFAREALEKGHEVTVLTRDAGKVATRHERLHVVEGYVTDRNTVHNVLDGQEAVIQTLGIGGKGDGRPTTFVSEANKSIMEEMERMNVRRLVAISVIGAGDSLAFLPWIYRKLVLPLFMKWFQAIMDDKNRMEPMIKKSSLDWTIVRCTTVKERPATGKVNATVDGKGLKFSISAADMATIVNQLTDNRFLKQAPTISN